MDAADPTTAAFVMSSYVVDIDRRDLSYAANELLVDSTALCRALNHQRVEPVHVAWVLFSGAECASDTYRELGLTLLRRAGVEHAKCLQFLQEEMQVSCEKAGFAPASTFSVEYVKWIEAVAYEAELYRDRQVSIDHIAVALAVNLQQRGFAVGFSEQKFRAAAERVRGFAPPRREFDEWLRRIRVDIRVDKSEQLQVNAGAISPMGEVLLTDEEKDDLILTKLDRVSPASSAPDSPCGSEFWDSSSDGWDSPSDGYADGRATFADNSLDAMSPKQPEEHWRALVQQQEQCEHHEREHEQQELVTNGGRHCSVDFDDY